MGDLGLLGKGGERFCSFGVVGEVFFIGYGVFFIGTALFVHRELSAQTST